MKNDMEGVFLHDGKLWGRHGGLLEFVGVRLEWRQRKDGDWYPAAVLLFTDHDCVGFEKPLERGVHYRMELPVAEYLVA